MMVNNSTSINKRNNHLSLQTIKHDGQQFNQYQQKEQPTIQPVSTKGTTISHFKPLNMMVNNSTSINKRNNHLSLQTIKHDGQQFNQYQQKEQPSLTSNH